MSDAVCANRIRNPQVELDTDFIIKSLRDGDTRTRQMIEKYEEKLKTDDKFSPSHQQPFLSDNQIVMTALHCKDPADVTAVVDPNDSKKIDFHIDFWRADTNEIYETAKGHPVTPGLIAGADQALNSNIPADDREQAAAQFNERARNDKEPMEVTLNPQTGALELKAADRSLAASK